jgi:hypothetical protein
MMDIAVAYNRYAFLGYEFLTWLWFLVETDPETLRAADAELAALEIGNRLVLENRLQEAVETITIRGDDAGLEEGRVALRKGALVSELSLFLKAGDNDWRFTLKGESLMITGLKTPEAGPVEAGEALEGRILEKLYLYERPVELIDALYQRFIVLRISAEWAEVYLPRLRAWAAGGGTGSASGRDVETGAGTAETPIS